jgi:hypothetical protein
VRKRLIAVVAVAGVAASACEEMCLSACEDRYEKCLASGGRHDDCHSSMDQCVEACPRRVGDPRPDPY